MASVGGDELLAIIAQQVLLAFDEPGTISEAAKGEAEKLGHHGMNEMHVKTALGEKFYHLPIGSLIIKHEGLAHDEAKGHKLIQQGEHTMAVPHDADVLVPKDTDLSNEAEVKNAAKHIIVHGPEGAERHATVTDQGGVHEIPNAGKKQWVKDELQQNWKKLPDSETKKPVTFEGKPAAWVPSDWQIHKSAASPESKLTGKWAKDPDGKWHLVEKTGEIKPWNSTEPDQYLKDGKLVPDEHELPKVPAGHLEPSAPGAAKVDIGGVAATKDEIHQAIEILNKDHSTAVKQPLKAKGHPLAAMDYHGVSKAEIAAHPDLKIGKGSKQAHVGQVKLAVLHHLAAKAESFPQTQAEEHVTQQATEETEAAAHHAQELTPALTDIGGVSASKEDIEGAIKALEGTKATAIKQTLAHQHNPLAGSDYWHVVKSHQSALPVTTKGMSAKQVYIHHLQQELAKLGKADEESGHDAKVAAHETVAKGEVASHPEPGSLAPKIADALKQASGTGHAAYVAKAEDDSGHVVTPTAPESGFKATPEHQVSVVHGAEESPLPDKTTHHLIDKHFTVPAKSEAPAAKPEVAALPGEPVKPGSPEEKELQDLIEHAAPAGDAKTGTVGESLASALKLAHASDSNYYVVQSGQDSWKVTAQAPVVGQPGSPAAAVYVAGPSLHGGIEGHGPSGQVADLSPATALAMVKPHLSPAAAEPAEDEAEKAPAEAAEEKTEEAGEDVPVMISGQVVAHMPAGTKVYAKPTIATMRYAHKPDGTWVRIYKNGYQEPVAGHVFDQSLKDGSLKEEGITEGVKELADSQSEKTVPVTIQGKHAYDAPAGSKVFHTSATAPDETTSKYVYSPDGSWTKVLANAHEPVTSTSTKQAYGAHVASGLLTEEKPAEAAEETAGGGTPSAPEAAPTEGIPVTIKGETKYTAPAGSKVYFNTHEGLPDQVKEKHVIEPDGSTKTVSSSGLSTSYSAGYTAAQIAAGSSSYDHYKQDTGSLTSDQELTKQILPGLKNSAVDPAMKDKGNFQQQLAAAAQLASAESDKKAYLLKSGDNWTANTYHSAYSKDDHYVIDASPGGMSVTHVLADGTKEQVPLQHLADAVGQHMTPNSVVVNDQLVKHGFYYSPKGKAHLEVKPPSGTFHSGYNSVYKYGEAGKASYVWHKQDGTAESITPTAAAKKLETSTEYHAAPKPDVPVIGQAKKVEYATTPKPGAYKMWSGTEHAPSSTHGIDMNMDGSGLLTTEGSSAPLTHGFEDSLVQTGMMLDQHGTSLVKPGIKPQELHVFGSPAMSPDDIKGLITDLETHYGDNKQFMQDIKDKIPEWDGGVVHKAALAFLAEHGAADASSQKTAFLGLFRELSEIPDAQAGDFKDQIKEPQFLKGLPPGISSAHDVFDWTDQGTAKPFGGTIAPYAGGNKMGALSNLTAPELSDKMKAVSAQYGGGKIVGTHPSGLSKDEKVAWLDAWRKGDMKTVFALDAKGGKVSPAHPGAPENTATHQMSWSAWDPSQISASKDIEGTWSDPDKVTLPKAEIANYLIKSGVQHSEHLSAPERRALVIAHRQHNQEIVDHLSKLASDRFDNGENPVSDAPEWTDNLQPAKSYDINLEESTPAHNWTEQAKIDFAKDNEDTLSKYALANGGDVNFTPGQLSSPGNSYSQQLVIQKYLDDKEAAALAEKLKPRYRLMPEEGPGVAGDQFGRQFTFTPGTAQELQHLPALSSLTSAWGFLTPRTHLAQLEDGTHGALTQRLPHSSTLADVPGAPGKMDFSKLSPGEVRDIAREHVLAWATDNPTSTPGEYLRTSDGRIVNSSTAGALQDFGKWNGLAGDAKANGPAVQPSTALYDAIRNHEVTKDVADNAYAGAIQAARRMQMMPDSRIHELLDGPYGAQVAQQVANRTATLEPDVDKMWSGIYKDAGWTKPEVAAEALPHGLHSGFSEPTFFNHVMAAKSYGVPAFFGGPHLEDSNFHVWTELAGEGDDANRYIRGESSLRGQALQDVSSWAAAHVEGAPSSSVTAGSGLAPKGELGWHTDIVSAAKKVSLHAPDQLWEGPQTKAALEKMDTAKTQLQNLKSGAESVIQEGPDSPAYAQFKAFNGAPEQVQAASSHYLDQIGKIEDAKATAGTFKPGDLPRWEAPPEPEKADEPVKQPSVKVELRTATRMLTKAQPSPNGSIDGDHILGEDDGELHLGNGVYSYHGSAWHVTLPTGEHIEISDEEKTNSYTAHAGRVRFRAVASDGSASLERIRSQLQEMGLPMNEATPDDMELFYWRHLANILADRMDSKQGAHAQVWNSLKDAMTSRKMEWDGSDLHANVESLAHSSLSAPEEQGIWRDAWSHLSSPEQVQKFVEKDGFLPHQDNFDVHSPEVPNGKPFWYRFDADPEQLAKQQMPAHGLYDPSKDPVLIGRTGGLYSTEARLRTLGIWKSGKSSDSDQTKGSAGFLFTRQGNQSGSGAHIVLSPQVLARTSNYSYNGDNYGNTELRKTTAPFDLTKALGQTGGGNETMVKDGVGLLGNVEAVRAYDEKQRGAIIAELKSHGITTIRGLPVEDRIVTDLNHGTINKLRGAMQPSSWFAHPEVPYTPPEAEHVSKAKSAVETAEEMASVEEGGSTDKAAEIATAAKGVAYSADHSPGASEPDVSNVFYHSDSKPSGALSQAPAVKGAVAQRVADTMETPDEDIKALYDAAGLHAQDNWGATPRARMAAAMIATHAQGNSSPFQLALQNETHNVFGVDKEALQPLGFATPENIKAAEALQEAHGPALRDFIRSQWEGTQKDLGDAGIHHVTVYRAFHFNGAEPAWAASKKGDVITAPQARPFSSWSFRQEGAETAGTFASGGHTVVVKATVPREQILSYPRSGLGCYNEGEFVVADAPGEWEVIKS